MAATMAGVASELGAPVLVCLEGGYDTTALAASVLATLEGLDERSGKDFARPDESLAEPYRERVALLGA